MLRRSLIALALCVGSGSLLTVVAEGAAAAPRPAGSLTTATQDTFAHKLVVRGWAYDAARPSVSITLKVYADGKYTGHVAANRASASVDKARKIQGKHAFAGTIRYLHTARRITIVPVGSHTAVASRSAAHTMPSPSTRIVTVAKRYVGEARFVEGGASPKRGFDCSGYTQYVYAQAKIRKLPHNAEAQRHVHGMRRISAHSARRGDLIFYMSGGYAYHVAIYAGHGRQYAAATPRDGIRYQHVWSSAVQYRTITH